MARRYEIRADGPDGRVHHFYADFSEQSVTAIDERDVEPLVEALEPLFYILARRLRKCVIQDEELADAFDEADAALTTFETEEPG